MMYYLFSPTFLAASLAERKVRGTTSRPALPCGWPAYHVHRPGSERLGGCLALQGLPVWLGSPNSLRKGGDKPRCGFLTGGRLEGSTGFLHFQLPQLQGHLSSGSLEGRFMAHGDGSSDTIIRSMALGKFFNHASVSSFIKWVWR